MQASSQEQPPYLGVVLISLASSVQVGATHQAQKAHEAHIQHVERPSCRHHPLEEINIWFLLAAL